MSWYRWMSEVDDPSDEVKPVDDSEQVRGRAAKEKMAYSDEICARMTEGKKHSPYLYREGGTLTSEYLGKP